MSRAALAIGTTLGLALCMTVARCTPGEQRAVNAAAPAVTTACTLALTFADPTLTPLCTDIPSLVAAITALFPEGAATLEGGDAGTALARATAALTPDQEHRLHDWLLQHGAVPLGG